MNYQAETIAAIATPPGRGGVGIVRVSGPLADKIAVDVLGHVPTPRMAEYLAFNDHDGTVIDTGLALYFTAPHSFTGEDVLELQGHGGPVVMDLILQRVLMLGARAARPGEFSERAFMNDKIDLVQAEAIADLIDSASTQAACCAMRTLQGEFSNRIHALIEQLIQLRLYVESALDFPEEEIDFLSDEKVVDGLQIIITSLQQVQAAAQQGRLLSEGMNVVIVGRPNAGKSSLLNCLAQRESAIVTEIPGTTRDVLREHITIDGLPLHIIDTAGLHDSEDPVEQLGMQRAWDEIENADQILLMIDDSADDADSVAEQLMTQLPEKNAVTIVRNKIDISKRLPALQEGMNSTSIYLSALTGAGVELLCQHLKDCMGYKTSTEGSFTARRRHLDALQRASSCLEKGQQQLQKNRAGELLAEELRQAQQTLGEITGEFSADDLLGRIFASFCIGK